MDKTLCVKNPHDFDIINHSAIKEYFSKPDKNKLSPSILQNEELNISVMIYFCFLDAEQIQKIHLEIEQTIARFKKYFNLSPCLSITPTIFNIFVFNNKDDYDCFADSREVTFKINGGRSYYVGRSDSHSEIYLYNNYGIANLKHEMAHALTFYVTKGNFGPLPIVLIEGIAEYFEHHRSILYIDKKDYEYMMSKDLMKFNYSKSFKKNISIYRIGYAIVCYLQNERPEIINDIFTSLREEDAKKFNALFAEILDARATIKNWACKNSLEFAATASNLLFIKSKPLKIIKWSQLSDDFTHCKYSTAFITDCFDRIVGAFPHTLHMWINKKLYSIAVPAKSSVSIHPNYHFIRMINKNKFAYCNKQGDLYRDSEVYKSKISNLIYNKIPDIAASKKLLNTEECEAHCVYRTSKINYSKLTANYTSMNFFTKNTHGIDIFTEISKKCHELSEAKNNFFFISAKNKNFDKEFYDYFSGNKYWPDPIYKSIFKNAPYKTIKEAISYYNELINIDAQQIKPHHQEDNIQNIFSGKIIPVSKGGEGKMGQALLYEENQKIAELSTEVGFFEQGPGLEGNESFFVFKDFLSTQEIYFNNSPTLALVKYKENYRLELVRKLFVNDSQENEANYSYSVEEYQIGMQHFFECDLNKLIANKIMRASSNCIEDLSSKLCSKELQTKQPSHLSQKTVIKTEDFILLENRSFYMSSEIKDIECNPIIYSVLFIEDHEENRRWHLPNKFNHLKLKRDDSMKTKLVPSDQYGNEDTQALRHIPEHCRHISPRHIYTRTSNSSLSGRPEFHLLDLINYQSETLFSIKPDLYDMELQETTIPIFNGKISLDTKLYQVKVYYNGTEIGVLNNIFFMGKNKINLPNKNLSDRLPSNNPNEMEVTKKPDTSTKEKKSHSLHDNLVYVAASLLPQGDQLYSQNSSINGDSSSETAILAMLAIDQRPTTLPSLI